MVQNKRNAFTLIELSIVIVIIGFLVAGITVGSSMIKQSQIRSVITDMQRYQTAYNAFVARFNAVPGDMLTAYNFWPSTTSTDAKYCASDAAHCNGDGNGLIAWNAAVAKAAGHGGNEIIKAWRHLLIAEMISAGINPIDNAIVTLTVGQNAPGSKIQSAGFFIAGADTATPNTYLIGLNKVSPWNDARTNAVFLGKAYTNTTLIAGALKAEEAYNIDNKIDDGVVDTTAGLFRGANSGIFRAIDGADAAANACVLASGAYNVTDNGSDVCVVGMALN